jgi:hypothetical protein
VVERPRPGRPAGARRRHRRSAADAMSDQARREGAATTCVSRWGPPPQRSAPGTAARGSAESDLVDLCRYLRVKPERFDGGRDRYFSALTALLRFHQVIGHTEHVEAGTFRSATREFQRAVGLSADGIPGEDTLWELNYSWTMANRLELVTCEMDDGTPPGTRHVDAQHGCLSVRVRSDVAPALTAWRTDLRTAGVPLTSSGARRELTAVLAPGRSVTSIHYGAAAVDLATTMGMTTEGPVDPDDQPYTIAADGDRWRVWARTDYGVEVSLDAVSWANGGIDTRRVEGRFLDVTAAAAVHGLVPIGPRSCFPRHYPSAEWWHFESAAALVPWISQFGCEVLRLRANSEPAFQAQRRLWAARKRIFRRGSGAGGEPM